MGRPVAERPVERVVLDAMGVLYEQRAIPDLLRAFARARGSSAGLPAVRKVYWSASTGELTSAELWEALGIPGPDRDAEFLGGRLLMPGARRFLDAMAAQGIPVGAITNDVAAWSVHLRRQHALDGVIQPWTVSAEVGVRKPDPHIYEAFLAAAGAQPAGCVFVDDKAENLDAARELGFRTVLFSPEPGAAEHPRVGSFDDLLTWISRMQPTSVG
jgi:FMN phosphatase YigB (HAD superfamily)